MITGMQANATALTDSHIADAHIAIFRGESADSEAARLGTTPDALFAAWTSWIGRQRAKHSPSSAAHGRIPGVRQHEQAEVREAFRAAGVLIGGRQ